jgi:hypothetical protein
MIHPNTNNYPDHSFRDLSALFFCSNYVNTQYCNWEAPEVRAAHIIFKVVDIGCGKHRNVTTNGSFFANMRKNFVFEDEDTTMS